MSARPSLDELFERRITYPDFDPQERLARLVGLDGHKARLTNILSLLVNPAGLEAWAKKHHPGADGLMNTVLRRPPLVVLAGDVGSGKSELAETIGDAVARQEKIEITLFPLSLSTRGQGRVGEMTQLLSMAFDITLTEAGKLKGATGRARGAVILLVDEADALAQSREAAQMHHEDRAGVNALIRGVDRLANGRVPAAVIMCTNRLSALDPAVKRRAADILTFSRPDEAQRRAVLAAPLQQLGFSRAQIAAVVAATGEQKGRPYGFHLLRSDAAAPSGTGAGFLSGRPGEPGTGCRDRARDGSDAAIPGREFMTQAVAVRRDGDAFQARLFWRKAARLLDPESPIVRVGFESGPKGYDDIWVAYEPSRGLSDQEGCPLFREHIQCKWHVSPDSYGHAHLVDAEFINANALSLLQRALAAQRLYAPDGRGARFRLITNWLIDRQDPLRELVHQRSHTLRLDRLFGTATERRWAACASCGASTLA